MSTQWKPSMPSRKAVKQILVRAMLQQQAHTAPDSGVTPGGLVHKVHDQAAKYARIAGARAGKELETASEDVMLLAQGLVESVGESVKVANAHLHDGTTLPARAVERGRAELEKQATNLKKLAAAVESIADARDTLSTTAKKNLAEAEKLLARVKKDRLGTLTDRVNEMARRARAAAPGSTSRT